MPKNKLVTFVLILNFILSESMILDKNILNWAAKLYQSYKIDMANF